MLELRELTKRFQLGGGQPIRAVDGVSLKVAGGQMVVFYGPSGSGKTTLLNLIAGLTPLDSGTVLIDGRDLSSMSAAERDSYRLNDLGIVGHPGNLIPGARAIENASLKVWLSGLRSREATRRIEHLLDDLGLGDRMAHRTEQLSMGERQRVLIALALSMDPKVLLADEPTGNLDSERTIEVLELLRRVASARGAAVLLASHDPEAAAFADAVYELRDGQLREYAPVGNDRVPASSAREK